MQSPWANSHKVLLPLLQKLKPYYPDFNAGKLTKEKLLQRVQPDGTYSLSRINNLLSKGFIAAEEFLVFQNLRRDENLRNDLLTRELQSRHLEDWFFKRIDSEIERLDNKEVKDWEDHLDLLRLHRRVYHHPTTSTRMRPGGQTIVEMGNQIDLTFLLEKALIINEKNFRNRILKNENHDIRKELEIWNAAAKEINHPAINIYRLRFQYNEENLVEQFFKIKSAFFKNYSKVSQFGQQTFLLSLINDANFIRKKGLISIEDVLSIYKFGFDSKIQPLENRISEMTYTTVVSFSNATEDFDYTEHFIENYTKYLEEEKQEEGKNWAMAHLNYRKGELQRSLDILLKNTFNSLYFKRINRILSLQVYFDLCLNNQSYLEYFLDYSKAFEKWLFREKNYSDSRKQAYLRFIQKSKELVKWKYESGTSKDSLPNFLNKEPNIIAADWLTKRYEKIRDTKK